MKLKKLIALLLCLAMALSLCACGQKETAPVVAEVEEEIAPAEDMPEMNGAPDEDPTWQLDVMERNADLWLTEGSDEEYISYSITDWDHNGLYEMNVTTYSTVKEDYALRTYEVAADRSGLVEIATSEDGVYPPYDALECYYTENDYYYVFGRIVDSGNPDRFLEEVYALSKNAEGEMVSRYLGALEGTYDNMVAQYDTRFYDVNGSPVEGDPTTEVFPWLLATEVHCLALRYSVNPEWFDGDIQTMLGATMSGWYQEKPTGPWFELEMYTDPNHFSWNEVENPEFIDSQLPATGLEVPIRIIPSEDVIISLDVGNWTFLPLTFRGETAFIRELKAGQAYEFKVPMGEVLPLARLYATSGPDQHLFYDFAMDGSGEAPVMFHLMPDIPKFPNEYDSFMELCVAYAAIAAKNEDHYGIGWDHIWEALANGVTRYAMRWSDPDNQGNIYVDEDDMNRFIEIMSPYGGVPDLESGSNVTRKDGEYVVSATFDDAMRDAFVHEVQMAGDASNGKAIVVLPAFGNMDVEVTFELAADWQDHVDNPWVITGAIYGYG